MIALVLFVVFFALWLISAVPREPNPLSAYGGWLALICVGILGFVVFHGRL